MQVFGYIVISRAGGIPKPTCMCPNEEIACYDIFPDRKVAESYRGGGVVVPVTVPSYSITGG